MKSLPDCVNKEGKRKLNSGQALLVVLLSMSVVLAVVLSSVSKSVTDISITGYEEDALRAFSAAEAGIEQALLEAVPGSSVSEQLDIDDPADPRYTADVTIPDAGHIYEYPDKLVSGQVATFWFVSHDDSGNLTCSGKTCTRAKKFEFCWTSDSAVEISLYYDKSDANSNLIYDSYDTPNNFAGLQVLRYNFDIKHPIQRNFLTPDSDCNFGSKYSYSTGDYFKNVQNDIDSCFDDLNNPCLIAARVRMLDNMNVGQDVALAIHDGNSVQLPAQGVSISSTGQSGESTREVTVLQGYPEPPDVFEGVLFSAQEITQ